MRNIPVLPVLVIMLFLFSAVFPENCEAESDYSFSIGTGFGIVYGQSLEYVYPTVTAGELLSELKYDMKPVSYLSLHADYSKTDIMSLHGLFASLAFKVGIPADSGTHENRDWMSIENGNLTHFSTHTNMTREFFWLDAAVGASFPVKSIMYIKPYISASWTHFAFTGRNGLGTYARKTGCACANIIHDPSCPVRLEPDFTAYDPISEDPFYYPFSGDVIRYQQDWLIFLFGLSLGTVKLSPFSFELSFSISPFTYCAAKDEHLTNNRTFMDFSGWGLLLEPKGRVSFALNQFLLSLEASYRFIGRTRGPAYNRAVNSGSYARNGEAGAGLSLLDARLSVSYRF